MKINPTKAFLNNVKWRDLRLMMRVNQAIKVFSGIEIKEQKTNENLFI
ncbi:hypothetical protein ID0444_08320 [Helicobacter pylori]